MMVWQPGMLGECIHVDPAHDVFADARNVVKGTVYTVRQVRSDDLDGKVLLWLAEIDNSHLAGRLVCVAGTVVNMLEPGFPAAHFRPLASSRLDALRAHLAPAPYVVVPA